jgi:hypothetical protein
MSLEYPTRSGLPICYLGTLGRYRTIFVEVEPLHAEFDLYFREGQSDLGSGPKIDCYKIAIALIDKSRRRFITYKGREGRNLDASEKVAPVQDHVFLGNKGTTLHVCRFSNLQTCRRWRFWVSPVRQTAK